jgi:hypothetical protein
MGIIPEVGLWRPGLSDYPDLRDVAAARPLLPMLLLLFDEGLVGPGSCVLKTIPRASSILHVIRD